MIAIGSAVNNFYLGRKDDNSANEYICWDEEEKKEIEAEIGLTKKDERHSNHSSVVYVKDSIHYTIHDIKKLAVFQDIEKYLFLPKYKRIMAPPLLVYAWTKTRAAFRNDNLADWENNIVTASFLYHKYMKKISEKLKFRARIWSSHLTYFGAMAFGAHFKEHTFKEYTEYTEHSLFDLFRYNGHFSLYEKCLITTFTRSRVLSSAFFDTLSKEDQLGLVMERLYVDCSNEFIIEELLYEAKEQIPTIDLFKTVIMYRCSQNSLSWFRDYLIHNYNDIMSEFDEKFVGELYEAVKWQKLENV